MVGKEEGLKGKEERRRRARNMKREGSRREEFRLVEECAKEKEGSSMDEGRKSDWGREGYGNRWEEGARCRLIIEEC